MNSDPRNISIDDFDYPLPDERIAKHPLARRDACKLLVWKKGSLPSQHVFSELPSLLPPHTVLVCNNTRVINARLLFCKPTGARIEIFCLEPIAPADYEQNFASTESCEWQCLVGNSKRWKEPTIDGEIEVNGTIVRLTAHRGRQLGNAWSIRFSWTGGVTFADVIGAAGQIPIPPYLNRNTEDSDSEDYQTVYSHIDGSVAAPTAGLHFTPELLSRLIEQGIPRLELTLHVGAGTFQPVKGDTIGDHPMHREFIAVSRDVIESLADSVGNGYIVAVGTTSVRTLESLYHAGCMMADGRWNGEVPQWYPYEPGHPSLAPAHALKHVLDYLDASGSKTFMGATRIIITPGYTYRIVKGMVTNFHQPRSTLLLLVSAFMGGDSWRDIYDFALANGFRFLSYGDACLLLGN